MGRLTGVASKVENILKGSLDLIPSPSTMVFKVWVHSGVCSTRPGSGTNMLL